MKFLSLAILLFSSSAYACPHSLQQFICPGDGVADKYTQFGTVVAVNPFKKQVTYKVNNVPFTANIADLALAAGCLDAFCIGDTVTDRSSQRGTVIAVNPYQNIVAYKVNGIIFNSRVTDLQVGYGCTFGYCVGDGVSDKYGQIGVIIALSPYENKAAYVVNGVIFAANIEDLGNTNFCADYGDQQRGMNRFPGNQHPYLAPNFHYYSRR